MDADKRGGVTYVGEVLEQLSQNLEQLQMMVKLKVLPGSRAPLTLKIRDAHTQVQQVRELLDRANMSKRLGFVQQNDEIQPVMTEAPDPVNATE